MKEKGKKERIIDLLIERELENVDFENLIVNR